MARAFAKTVINSFPSENQPNSRCIDGYLLIDNVVIAPVTMFQTSASFPALKTIVNNVLSNADRTPLDFNMLFFYQLRHSIVTTLYEHYNVVSFIFDGNGARGAPTKPSEDNFVDVSEVLTSETSSGAMNGNKPQPLLPPTKAPPASSSAWRQFGAAQNKAPSTKFVANKRGAADSQGFREPLFPCSFIKNGHVATRVGT